MSATQHDEAGISSAPVGERIHLDLPAPTWWRSRWGLAAAVLGLLLAAGGGAWAVTGAQAAAIQKIRESDAAQNEALGNLKAWMERVEDKLDRALGIR